MRLRRRQTIAHQEQIMDRPIQVWISKQNANPLFLIHMMHCEVSVLAAKHSSKQWVHILHSGRLLYHDSAVPTYHQAPPELHHTIFIIQMVKPQHSSNAMYIPTLFRTAAPLK